MADLNITNLIFSITDVETACRCCRLLSPARINPSRYPGFRLVDRYLASRGSPMALR